MPAASNGVRVYDEQRIHHELKKQNTLFLPVTSANADRFSKFFYRETQQ